MAPQKPLPPVPYMTTLSIDARDRRATLIRHILTLLEDNDGLAGQWTGAFEAALDYLSSAAMQDDWLAGIRKARAERKMHQREDEKDQQDQQDGGDDKEEHSEASGSSAFSQLSQRVATPITPSPNQLAKHLVLCLAPMGSHIPVPAEDSGFDIIPSTVRCAFRASVFSVPDKESILFGLDNWDWSTKAVVKLVGGTFTLRGVASLEQHARLQKALRLSIYIHLSLLLEQNFLSDSFVPMVILAPVLPQTPPVLDSVQSPTSPTSNHGSGADRFKGRNSFIPSSILSFFSKKTHTNRPSFDSLIPRGGSLDLSSRISSPLSSISAGRRISFMSDERPSLMSQINAKDEEESDTDPELKYCKALKSLEGQKHLLSSSIGVTFAPPTILVDIAKKEGILQNFRLQGDERVGLNSVLGWESKANGLCGIAGFVRHQQFTVLISRHSPVPTAIHTHSSESTNTTASAISTATAPRCPRRFVPCVKPRLETYRYYSRNADQDQDLTLGDYIIDLVDNADGPCSTGGCEKTIGEHEMRYIHGGVKIGVTAVPRQAPHSRETAPTGSEETADEDKFDDIIEMWLSCSECQAESTRRSMNNGTFLLSFGKMLELMVYSPLLSRIEPSICEHTRSPKSQIQSPDVKSSTLSPSRFNIVRHFAYHSKVLEFTLEALDNVFEIRVPRLQIVKPHALNSVRNALALNDVVASEDEIEEEKTVLRREIRNWWAVVADHLDILEEKIASGETIKVLKKALPRLPSEDDAYDDYDDEVTPTFASHHVASPTMSLMSLPPLPPSVPGTPSTTAVVPDDQELFPRPASSMASSISSASSAASSSSLSAIPLRNPAELLSSLRQTFHGIEQSLYANLARTPVSSLNDVRRAFLSAARGAERRLVAWQQKHIATKDKQALKFEAAKMEPEWMNPTCHVAPGGNIVVREGDWGSIIAFTMSTAEYRKELSSMAIPRSTSAAPVSPVSPNPPPSSSSSFFSSATGGYTKLFQRSAKSNMDPDEDGVVWHEPEGYSAVISRKEHPRDPTSLLSIREVLRNKAPEGSGAGILSASRFASLGAATGARLSGLTGGATGGSVGTNGARPPSSWSSKPDVKVSMAVVDGQVSAFDDVNKLEKELESNLAHPRAASSLSGSLRWGTGDITKHLAASQRSSSRSRSRSNSLSSRGSKKSKDSDVTVGPDPLLLTDADVGSETGAVSETPSRPTLKPAHSNALDNPPPTNSSSNFSSSLANGFTNAMRFVLSTGDNDSQSSERHPPPKMKKHALLGLGNEGDIDDRPHIKYDWMIGQRLKFSCTVYYAREFDSLRRRCGIPDHDVFLKSLSKSANWAAEGGKSKSNFWKTGDDRFIIKTLVNAWNVADLQVLIDLAPSYFTYISSTASRATVLAKLVGFYTVEIRNLQTNTVHAKADLLVMENLFYGQKVEQTFDLKGIVGRRYKAKEKDKDKDKEKEAKEAKDKNKEAVTEMEKKKDRPLKTLFDGDWIDGQQHTQTLVQPHSKVVLDEALKSDAEFLAKSNIMDYSLLLGIDTEKKQIRCGLVDTIGSYTFAKTLEYKAKQGLVTTGGLLNTTTATSTTATAANVSPMKSAGVSKGFGANGNPAATQTKEVAKEVTVIPPTEYQERFVRALDGYFTVCPDKWTTQPHDPHGPAKKAQPADVSLLETVL